MFVALFKKPVARRLLHVVLALLLGLVGVTHGGNPLQAEDGLELDDLPNIPGPNQAGREQLYRSLLRPESPRNPYNSRPVQETSSSEPAEPQAETSTRPILPLPEEVPTTRRTEQRATTREVSRPVSPQPTPRVEPPIQPAPETRRTERPALPTTERPVQRALPEPATDRTPESTERPTATAAAAAAVGVATRAAQETTHPSLASRNFRYFAPAFYRGIYLTSSTARTPSIYGPLLARARERGINVLVVDAQPRLPDAGFIRLARESNFYLVSRVVVFDRGLNTYPPPRERIDRVLEVAQSAADAGFMEVQLDYIRFSDYYSGPALSLQRRYETITEVLQEMTGVLHSKGVRVGADIFGRIPFNRNDRIGQQLELFSEHLDTIYPMLYPSHFYGEPNRIKDPYTTVLQGIRNSVERAGDRARIIAYIQGFQMSVGPSGLSYTEYIRKQIQAAQDAGGAGFIVWNARNSYEPFFRALEEHDRRVGLASEQVTNE